MFFFTDVTKKHFFLCEFLSLHRQFRSTIVFPKKGVFWSYLFIGLTKTPQELWTGAANVTQCHVKLNVTQNTKRRVMNLKIKRDSRNVAYGTPRKRRNAPYTAARDLSRGPKAAVMTLLKVSNDS